MKSFTINISSYGTIILFMLAAVFSPSGMGITVEGMQWLSTVAGIIENFVVVFAILAALIGAILIVVLVKDTTFFSTVAEELVKKHGAKEAHKKVNPLQWTLIIPVVFWVFLIAAGWIVSAIMFMFATLGTRLFAAATQKEIENTPQYKEYVELTKPTS